MRGFSVEYPHRAVLVSRQLRRDAIGNRQTNILDLQSIRPGMGQWVPGWARVIGIQSVLMYSGDPRPSRDQRYDCADSLEIQLRFDLAIEPRTQDGAADEAVPHLEHAARVQNGH